jgi:hypothetical protein
MLHIILESPEHNGRFPVTLELAVSTDCGCERVGQGITYRAYTVHTIPWYLKLASD